MTIRRGRGGGGERKGERRSKKAKAAFKQQSKSSTTSLITMTRQSQEKKPFKLSQHKREIRNFYVYRERIEITTAINKWQLGFSSSRHISSKRTTMYLQTSHRISIKGHNNRGGNVHCGKASMTEEEANE